MTGRRDTKIKCQSVNTTRLLLVAPKSVGVGCAWRTVNVLCVGVRILCAAKREAHAESLCVLAEVLSLIEARGVRAHGEAVNADYGWARLAT